MELNFLGTWRNSYSQFGLRGRAPRGVTGELPPASVYVSLLPVVEACVVVAVPGRVGEVRVAADEPEAVDLDPGVLGTWRTNNYSQFGSWWLDDSLGQGQPFRLPRSPTWPTVVGSAAQNGTLTFQAQVRRGHRDGLGQILVQGPNKAWRRTGPRRRPRRKRRPPPRGGRREAAVGLGA